jgi:hypothetical protein
LCIFDDFFLGGKVYIFDKEIKKIERILICINSRTFSVFVPKNTFIHAFCIKLKFILKIDCLASFANLSVSFTYQTSDDNRQNAPSLHFQYKQWQKSLSKIITCELECLFYPRCHCYMFLL